MFGRRSVEHFRVNDSMLLPEESVEDCSTSRCAAFDFFGSSLVPFFPRRCISFDAFDEEDVLYVFGCNDVSMEGVA